MDKELRTVGIPGLDEAPWGTHFCQFYETKDDLIDLLVPYIKTGLENNEFCLWVTSTCVDEKDARRAMTETMSQFDRYVQDGRIEIVPVTDWPLEGGGVDFEQVHQDWIDKHAQALARGYDGMRITGDVPCNIATLPNASWKDFAGYEQLVDKTIHEYKMLILCTYALDKCKATAILDVMQHHQFALIERKGMWERIESAELKRTKAELKKLNDQLEALVDDRTIQLKTAIEELQNEIAIRKRAEDALREANKRVEMILDSITDKFFAVDDEWRYTYFNKHAEEQLKALGKDPASLIGKVLWDEFPNPPGEEIFRRAMSERVVVTQEHYYPPLQEWVENRIYPSPDGGLAIFVNYITERKQAEESLLEMNVALMNAMPGISLLDLDGRFLKVNDDYARMVGYEARKMIGMGWVATVSPDDRNIAFAAYQRMLNEGKAEFEAMAIRKDGSMFPKHVLIVKRLDKEGHFIGHHCCMRDITERKRAEEIQAQFLERVISAQEEERRRIAQELHDETGQSLMFLLVGLRTIQDSRTLKEVKAQAARLRKVTSQAMKEVQRLAHGLRPSMLDDMGLEAALERYASDFAHAHRIAAEVDAIGLGGERLPVHIETTLFRIAQEALTNVVKHADAKHVSILLNRHVSDIQMVVEDDGIGVELRSDSKTAPSSFHLGLYGMCERVSMLGGTIAIESARRKGTTIHVRIPLARKTT
jgi:PAS domain S-box-containing protein